MRVTGRLVLGVLVVVAIAIMILFWGPSQPPVGRVAIVVVCVVALAIATGRSIAIPLTQLSSTARAIATGTTPRFPHSKIPELNELVHGLREMHVELSHRIDELAREKAASTAIVDAMSEGIVASDATGKIVIANPSARRLLSYGPTDPLPALQKLFGAKESQEVVAEVLKGAQVQDREVQRDGKTLAINARSISGSGVVLVIRDLTEVRRLESIRRDFVANVSHELKTPLTSIAGYAETLAADDIEARDRARFLDTIRSNASRMQALVDDLLDLSRIESGHWTPRVELLNLEVAVQEAWWMVADKANRKDVSLKVSLASNASSLTADPNSMRQIIGNLLDNSIRYAHSGGQIEVSSRLVGNSVEFGVADNGIGIPPDHLPRIFERFYRVDPSRSREEGGTGLGLAIVRHMVEAHGGNARVESVLRQGTKVILSFPASPIPPAK